MVASWVLAVSLTQFRNLPPGALISIKKMNEDQRAEPQFGERIPYLVVYRGLDKKLMDCVVSPDEYINDRHAIEIDLIWGRC